MQHTIREELRGVGVFIAIIWAVYIVDLVLPGTFNSWGLVPRTFWGLLGIPLSPFLHGSFGHLLSNTIPLAILLALLAGSRTRTWETVAELVLLGGAMLWAFGRSSVHIGASGLIYGLIAFLIVSGFREKRLVPMLVAVVVGFLYGSTLIFGVLPSADTQISWDGHLFGAIAGGLIGFYTVDRDPEGTGGDAARQFTPS